MHLYAFGSVCRGEVDLQSDVDLLAITSSFDPRFDPVVYSVYSYSRLRALWTEGNPFAWHLALESRLLFADDGRDFVKELGSPARYTRGAVDCAKFRALFEDAVRGFEAFSSSQVFELAAIFLAIRNIATCFSLSQSTTPMFGRDSARKIGSNSLAVNSIAYDVLLRARVLSTRGSGPPLTEAELLIAAGTFPQIAQWMDELVTEVTLQ